MAVAFENYPSIDQILFIDLAPTMSPDEELRLLCDGIMPRVCAGNPAISATVGYCWSSDCGGVEAHVQGACPVA